MKILFATTNFPPQTGGPSRQSLEIVEQLRALGHEVEVCLPRNAPDESKVYPGVWRLGDDTPGGRGKLLRWRDDWRKVRQRIRDFQPDVVHFQVFGGVLCLMFGAAAKLEGVPSIVKLTGERSFESSAEAAMKGDGWRSALRSRLTLVFHSVLDALILKTFSQLWVTSPEFRQRLARRRFAPASMVMIPNFIDLAPFEKIAEARRAEAKKAEAPVILTLCRLRPWKGLSTVIRAAALLKARGVDFDWRIHGDGPGSYRQQLIAEAQAQGVADLVHFGEAFSPTEVAEAYRQADLFVLLSDYEPFGIVLVEAMASGVPIVATSTGGIPFVMGEALQGNLAAPGDAEAAADIIGRLVADPAHRTQTALDGARRGRDFGLKAGIAALEAAYRDLLR